MTDQLQKYLFEDKSARIQTVKLTSAWQTGLAHQHYPRCIQRLLGELTSAAVLLSSNIKFDGSLVLQLQGDGPVALVVVECTSGLTIRATAKLREGAEIPEDGTLQSLLNSDGLGRFMVVLDPNRENTDMQPYQGIVPMEGENVAEVLEAYMRNSEQLDTRIWLAADAHRTAGVLLQRLPRQGGSPAQTHEDETAWDRALALTATIQDDELLDLDSDTLMRRLFWEETVVAFEPEEVRWWCPCTRERVANMLRMLGQQEVQQILTEREHIDVSCNFCGKPYRFDAVDCASLFIDKRNAPPSLDDSVH